MIWALRIYYWDFGRFPFSSTSSPSVSDLPTASPSLLPTLLVSGYPSHLPTVERSKIPSLVPSDFFSSLPSSSPSVSASAPPSQCTDEIGWTTFHPIAALSGKSCDTIEGR